MFKAVEKGKKEKISSVRSNLFIAKNINVFKGSVETV
jgi:hypothetical protein